LNITLNLNAKKIEKKQTTDSEITFNGITGTISKEYSEFFACSKMSMRIRFNNL